MLLCWEEGEIPINLKMHIPYVPGIPPKIINTVYLHALEDIYDNVV